MRRAGRWLVVLCWWAVGAYGEGPREALSALRQELEQVLAQSQALPALERAALWAEGGTLFAQWGWQVGRAWQEAALQEWLGGVPMASWRAWISLAPFHPQSTLRLVEGMPPGEERDAALAAWAEAMAEAQPWLALRAAKQVQEGHHREEAYRAVVLSLVLLAPEEAKRLAQEWPPPTNRSLWLEACLQWARLDPEQAGACLAEWEESEREAIQVERLEGWLRRGAWERALEVAETLRLPLEQSRGWALLAANAPQGEQARAYFLRALEARQSLVHPVDRTRAGLAILQAALERQWPEVLEVAQRTWAAASLVPEPAVRAEYLRRLAVLLRETNAAMAEEILEEAMRAASAVADLKERDALVARLAPEATRLDLGKALAWARGLVPDGIRSTALEGIALEEAQRHPERAWLIASEIPEPSRRRTLEDRLRLIRWREEPERAAAELAAIPDLAHRLRLWLAWIRERML